MIRFRPARPQDIPTMQTVMEDAIRDGGASHYDEDEIDALTQSHEERFFEAVLMAGSHVIVAEDETDVVGFGGVNTANGVLSSLFVHPEYTGRGIGTELLQRVEKRAVDVGCSELVIFASDNAVPFYEDAGYESIEPRSFETPDGRLVPCTFMRKTLLSEE